jgi:hypothetical protein
MKGNIAILMALAGAGLMAPSPGEAAAQKWYLMARHGECSEFDTLKKKIVGLGDIHDPQAFATFMRNKGYQVTHTDFPVPKGKAEEVKVPEQSLYLVFVTPEACTAYSKR